MYAFYKGRKCLGVARVELQSDGGLSELSDRRDDILRFRLVRVIGKDRVDATFGEAQDGIATEPSAAAGDDGDFRLGRGGTHKDILLMPTLS